MEQASRWFYGPGRFYRYLRDPVTVSGWRARLLATSAFAISVEWLADARMTAREPGMIIIDRSVHTLLAHCFALRRLLNDDYFGLAQRVIGESHVPLWPDHILYLDVPQCVIEARNDGKFAPGSIFIDAGFNAGVRSYFHQLAGVPSPRVVWLDATVDATMVRALAAAQLGRWLEQQDCG